MGAIVFYPPASSTGGGSGVNATSSIIAAVNLTANKAVGMTASGLNYVDVTQPTIVMVVGFTKSDCTAGNTAIIQTMDSLEGFSGLTTGSTIYLAANGAITQTAPTTGRLQKLGTALSATKINIQIQPPIYLG